MQPDPFSWIGSGYTRLDILQLQFTEKTAKLSGKTILSSKPLVVSMEYFDNEKNKLRIM